MSLGVLNGGKPQGNSSNHSCSNWVDLFQEFTLTAALTTYDPAYVDLCETWLQVSWTCSNGVITSSSRDHGDWDAQPSELNTNWYLDWDNYGTFSKSSNSVSTSTRHHNYDFLSDDVATYAKHNIYITGFANGSSDYDYTYTHSGESYILLKCRVSIF